MFFSLLRKALVPGGGEVDVAGADWDMIFSTACRHSVQAVMFDAVRDLPAGSGLSPLLAARWLMEAGEAEKEYGRIKSVVEAQRAVWESRGIDAVLLKGLESAKYYPVPEHRINGDIDWWMRGRESWDSALGWLGEEGIGWKRDSDGDISYEYSGVLVEHHRKGFAGEGPEAELLYLAEHVFHHAAVSGVGLRQVCDYAMALRYFDGTFDRDRYVSLAASRGFAGWVRLLDAAVALIMDGGEGLPAGLRRRAERLLALIMEDGNFGLDRKKRFGAFFTRAAAVGVSAPIRFILRWGGLGVGRLKRIL